MTELKVTQKASLKNHHLRIIVNKKGSKFRCEQHVAYFKLILLILMIITCGSQCGINDLKSF